jgi:hypothetical protein
MKTSFDMKLFDDESTREKLTVMTRLEAVFDDGRNIVPEAYWTLMSGLQPGEVIRITVEKLSRKIV